MKLNQLTKTVKKKNKRIGRGYGSGKGGHSSTRGTKGQKARNNIGLFFEGVKVRKSLLKRLPLYRGKGKFKSFKARPIIVNLKFLNLFKSGEVVDFVSLKEKGIIDKNLSGKMKIKILGDGEIAYPLTVRLPCSHGASEKIRSAGGTVEGEIEKLKVDRLKKKGNKKEK